jgi:4-amino-4-deoxy-L-arabinose transferase-like glycosyltransferase
MSPIPRKRRTAVSAISRQAVPLLILLTFTLLAAPLLTRSLQTDEASSIWFTRLPWDSFLRDFCDPHPPGYYLLLKLWLTGGTQAVWSRLPSLWAALLAIALTLRLGREWRSAGAGLLAAALLAFQPLTLWYAAQARMYALVMLLGVLVFWLGWRLWAVDNRAGNGRSPGWWLLYWLAASALLWADFTGLLVWGVLQLVWLATGRPHLRRWLLAQTAVFLPWLLLMRQLPASQTLTHSYQPIFVAIQALKFGVRLPPAQAAALLLAVLALAAAFGVFTALSGPRFYRRYPRPLHMVLTLLLVGGWLFLVLAAAVPRLYTLKRLITPLLPAFALAAAAVAANWRPRRAATLVLPGLLVCLFLLPRHQSDAWETAVPQIAKNAPQDAQFWVDDMVVPAFTYYAGPELDGRWVVLDGRALPQLPAADSGVPLILITSNRPYRTLVPLLPPAFRQSYQLAGEQNWPGVHAVTFQPRATPNPDAVPWPAPSAAAEWGLLLPSPLAACQTP